MKRLDPSAKCVASVRARAHKTAKKASGGRELRARRRLAELEKQSRGRAEEGQR